MHHYATHCATMATQRNSLSLSCGLIHHRASIVFYLFIWSRLFSTYSCSFSIEVCGVPHAFFLLQGNYKVVVAPKCNPTCHPNCFHHCCCHFIGKLLHPKWFFSHVFFFKVEFCPCCFHACVKVAMARVKTDSQVAIVFFSSKLACPNVPFFWFMVLFFYSWMWMVNFCSHS